MCQIMCVFLEETQNIIIAIEITNTKNLVLVTYEDLKYKT